PSPPPCSTLFPYTTLFRSKFMTYAIDKLYDFKDNKGFLDPDLCANINKELSALSHSDIPDDQIDNVVEYLSLALSMDAVHPAQIKPLDDLIEKLHQKP